MSTVNIEAIKEWVEALESGEYKQAFGKLESVDKFGSAFCCLGVACNIFQERLNLNRVVRDSYVYYNDAAGYLPKELMYFLGFSDSYGSLDMNSEVRLFLDDIEAYALSLSILNDTEALNFKQIAYVLRLQYLGEKYDADKANKLRS